MSELDQDERHRERQQRLKEQVDARIAAASEERGLCGVERDTDDLGGRPHAKRPHRDIDGAEREAARHRDQIDLWASQQKKMLFFAHSQGNLFVNRAYAHAASKTEGVGVKIVHVAPASPTLSGAHTLADKDMVINGLRLIGSVVQNTRVA